MWRNQIKITWRNLFKYPVYSTLNLGGLAIGIAASFVLLLYGFHELNYDRSFPDSDRTYRVATDFFNMGGFANSQSQLSYFLGTESEVVENVTSLDRAYQQVPFRVRSNDFSEADVFYIDSSFFEVFPFAIREGYIPGGGLAPNEAILSRQAAEKFFGNESAIGKVIEAGKERKRYQVVAVLDRYDFKTHINPNILLPQEREGELQTNWSSANAYNYVKLKPGATEADLQAYLDRLLEETVFPTRNFDGDFAAWKESNSTVKFFIQPLQDIYLYSNYKFELSAGGNPAQVRVLGIIGIFLILIASINYINLSTARASVRAKEVGIKKTLGLMKGNLVRQFLLESVMFSTLAMLTAAVLIEGLLWVFQQITGEVLVASLFSNWWQPAALLVFSVLIGLLAGVYPSFYLTSFKPVKVLKGDMTMRGNRGLRGTLVVVQFSIAIALIICSTVVFQQLQFMRNTDKGFEQEGVLVVQGLGALGEQSQAFRQEVERQSQVVSTSLSKRIPSGNSVWMYTYKTPAMTDGMTIQTFPVDDQYLSTMGMRLVDGRNFSREFASDSLGVIFNRAAVEALGLENHIGADVGFNQHVVGVIENFNFQSLRQQIEPAALVYATDGYNLAVKLQGNDMAGFLASLEQTWKQFNAEEPIQYYFLDDNFAKLAEKDQVLGRAISFFTLLTLFIACLGLLGLVAFTIEQRGKEIGIRKVLGASVTNIVTMLSTDFLKLVLISALIAFPIAWWAMSTWLAEFAYRTELSWWIFAVAGIVSVLIALVTISFQAIRAALANPVASLKTE